MDLYINHRRIFNRKQNKTIVIEIIGIVYVRYCKQTYEINKLISKLPEAFFYSFIFE